MTITSTSVDTASPIDMSPPIVRAVEPSGPRGQRTKAAATRERALADQLIDGSWLDELVGAAANGEVRLTGPGGFLQELVARVLEAGLQVELSDHLGYEAGDPAGRGSGNSRNGHTPKTLQTELGPVELAVPSDRNSSFEPRLVPKNARRLAGGLDDTIVSLYAGGMTVRDIEAHLARTLGVDVGRRSW